MVILIIMMHITPRAAATIIQPPSQLLHWIQPQHNRRQSFPQLHHFQSYSGSSATSDSVKSYKDAGYNNEEGIGGTAEESAILAEALMHTNVGPIADDLFCEEVDMFLRCRERHRMRLRRE
jgi:hypothetical protein